MYDEAFWFNLFSNLGFEKVEIANRVALKIPTYEAIYMNQLMGIPTFYTKKKSRGQCYIWTEDDEFLMFPNPVPSVQIKDITTKMKYQDTIEHQLNPLLSPSLNYMCEKYPSFFENENKYLFFGIGSGAAKQIIDESDLSIYDIVSLCLPEHKEDMNESLMTYIASSFLRKQGFIVDPFNEAFGSRGYPDLFAFKYPEIQNKLIKYGMVEGGFYLNELELDYNYNNTFEIEDRISALLEVESPGKGRFYSGKDETIKYLQDGHFDEGYMVVPFEGFRMNEWCKRGDLDIGYITVDDDGSIITGDCPIEYGNENFTDKKFMDLEKIIKLILLKNFNLRKVTEILPDVNSFYDVYISVDKIDLENILELVTIEK